MECKEATQSRVSEAAGVVKVKEENYPWDNDLNDENEFLKWTTETKVVKKEEIASDTERGERCGINDSSEEDSESNADAISQSKRVKKQCKNLKSKTIKKDRGSENTFTIESVTKALKSTKDSFLNAITCSDVAKMKAGQTLFVKDMYDPTTRIVDESKHGYKNFDFEKSNLQRNRVYSRWNIKLLEYKLAADGSYEFVKAIHTARSTATGTVSKSPADLKTFRFFNGNTTADPHVKKTGFMYVQVAERNSEMPEKILPGLVHRNFWIQKKEIIFTNVFHAPDKEWMTNCGCVKFYLKLSGDDSPDESGPYDLLPPPSMHARNCACYERKYNLTHKDHTKMSSSRILTWVIAPQESGLETLPSIKLEHSVKSPSEAINKNCKDVRPSARSVNDAGNSRGPSPKAERHEGTAEDKRDARKRPREASSVLAPPSKSSSTVPESTMLPRVSLEKPPVVSAEKPDSTVSSSATEKSNNINDQEQLQIGHKSMERNREFCLYIHKGGKAVSTEQYNQLKEILVKHHVTLISHKAVDPKVKVPKYDGGLAWVKIGTMDHVAIKLANEESMDIVKQWVGTTLPNLDIAFCPSDIPTIKYGFKGFMEGQWTKGLSKLFFEINLKDVMDSKGIGGEVNVSNVSERRDGVELEILLDEEAKTGLERCDCTLDLGPLGKTTFVSVGKVTLPAQVKKEAACHNEEDANDEVQILHINLNNAKK